MCVYFVSIAKSSIISSALNINQEKLEKNIFPVIFKIALAYQDGNRLIILREKFLFNILFK